MNIKIHFLLRDIALNDFINPKTIVFKKRN